MMIQEEWTPQPSSPGRRAVPELSQENCSQQRPLMQRRGGGDPSMGASYSRDLYPL